MRSHTINSTHIIVSEQFDRVTEKGYLASHAQLTEILQTLVTSTNQGVQGENTFTAPPKHSKEYEVLEQACENVARQILLTDDQMQIPLQIARSRVTSEFTDLQKTQSAGASHSAAIH